MNAQEQAIDTLARTIYGEARGEDLLGLVAVANVVMNRVARPRWWGRTVHGVCRKKWQFSCWLDSDPNLDRIKNITLANVRFGDCFLVAQLAIDGALKDITDGSTHYHAPSVKPRWARGKEPCVEIGAHAFYSDIAGN